MSTPSTAPAEALRGSAMQISARIAALVAGVVLAGFLARSLGTAGYGQYAVVGLLVKWCSVTIAITAGTATVRLLADRATPACAAHGVLRAAFLAGLVCTGLLTLAAEPFARLIHAPELSGLIRLAAWEIPFGAMAGVGLSVLTGRGRDRAAAWCGFLSWPCSLLYAILFVSAGMHAAGALAAVVCSSITVAATVILLGAGQPWKRGSLSWKQLLRPMRDISSASLLLRVLQDLDLFVVKALAGAVAAGLYAGALNIAIAPVIAASGMFPVMARALSKEHDHVCPRTFLRISLLMACGLPALTPLGEPLAVCLLGQKFASAQPILACLFWVSAGRMLTAAARTLLAVHGESSRRLLPLCLLLPVLAATLIFVVPRHGSIGAAIVTAVISCAIAAISLRSALRAWDMAFPFTTLFQGLCAAAISAGCTKLLLAQIFSPSVQLFAGALVTGGVFLLSLLLTRACRGKELYQLLLSLYPTRPNPRQS